MRPLEIKLKYQDRTLRQLKREGRVAIYTIHGLGDTLYGYEVVLIQIHPAKEIFGRSYPEREGYPSPEQWGQEAWSYGINQRTKALAQFNGLLKQAGERSTCPE